MSNLEVVRAWKDPEFRATLGSVIPDHPAGRIEFADPLLDRSTAAKLEPLNISGHMCRSLACTFSCTLTTHEKCCG
jgi:mersacidin/lichenicidin family type 2 lantibiotic